MDLDTTYRRVEELIFSHFPHTPTTGQVEACRTLVHFLYDDDPRSTVLLRGYAGTGKTSLVSALIQTAPQLHVKTQLLAPTGRAAKVLANYSGRTAYTIHKKIYTTVTDSAGVMHTARARNKHTYTLFIVDEASMIDDGANAFGSRKSLLEDLIDYVQEGSHCRLMLIGDTAQLPPVGATESPALDAGHLAAVGGLKVFDCELTEVVRQQQESGILHNATGLRTRIAATYDGEPVAMPLFDIKRFEDIVRLSGEDLEEVLNREYAGEGQEEVAVVCRSNKRANLYNQAIRNRVFFRESEINAGDILMVVKNNYYWLEEDDGMGFIANGDIVEVQSVRGDEEMYGFHFVNASLRFVDYDEAPTIECKLLLDTLHSESPSLTRDESQRLYDGVMADYADLPTKAERMKALRKDPYYNALQVKFAYALTCHKTQGGQWRTVIVEQGYLGEGQLDKEYLRWLYTALTRATEKVYLLNFHDDLFAATDN